MVPLRYELFPLGSKCEKGATPVLYGVLYVEYLVTRHVFTWMMRNILTYERRNAQSPLFAGCYRKTGRPCYPKTKQKPKGKKIKTPHFLAQTSILFISHLFFQPQNPLPRPLSFTSQPCYPTPTPPLLFQIRDSQAFAKHFSLISGIPKNSFANFPNGPPRATNLSKDGSLNTA